MSAADALQEQLLKALLPGAHQPPCIVSDARVLERLAAHRPNALAPRGHRSLPRIARGVLAFRLRGKDAPLPDLKYACYGLARPVDWEGRLLIDEAPLYRTLLTTVDGLANRPAAFADCYRGLLWAWLEDVLPDPGAVPQGASLHDYLVSRLPVLSRHPRPRAWVRQLLADGVPTSVAGATHLGYRLGLHRRAAV